MQKGQGISFSLTSLISWIILGTAGLLLTAVLLIVSYESGNVAVDSAKTLFDEISSKTTAQVNVILKSITILSDTAAPVFSSGSKKDMDELFVHDLGPMQALLDANPTLMSVYIGYENGAFHQLIAVHGNAYILQKYQAPSGTIYINRTIREEGAETPRERWQFLNAGMERLGSRTYDKVAYDPRKRPWYSQALVAGESVFTAPYIFSSSRLPGLTCARVLTDEGGVCGFDITLAQLSEILARQKGVPEGVLWIQTSNGKLVAYPGLAWKSITSDALKLPLVSHSPDQVLRSISSEIDRIPAVMPGNVVFLDVDDESYLAGIATIVHEGLNWKVVIAAPVDSITGYIRSMAFRIILISLGILVVIVPLALITVRKVSGSVQQLVRETKKIQHFDFSPSEPVCTVLTEVHELADTYEVMKEAIRTKTHELMRTQEKLDMLVRDGLALAAEKELPKLVSQIFQTAVELANADGGVMYLLEGDKLDVELLCLGKDNLILGGYSGQPAPHVMIVPKNYADLNKESVLYTACQAFNSKKMVTVQEQELQLFPTDLPGELTEFAITSLLAVPIVTRHDEVLGVIQLFNPRTDDNKEEKDSWPEKVGPFVSSLAAQAAVTLDNRNLVNSLKELFDALIKVLATSIDAKSAYTAGHCSRVPEITVMLAQAAHDADEGPLKDFRLPDEDAWRQLWLAAWLHDCGKVSTPEFVVDKATKLEAPYNRIHEIRMRFEVLRRDAEIAYYKNLAANSQDQDTLRNELEARLKQLEEEFEFVASCNLGTEFFAEEDKKRLLQISQQDWLRNYSDRLGISIEELHRKGDAPEPELPVAEKLLSDKVEDLIPRHNCYKEIVDAQGKPLHVPEYEYNRGELYNLCISRGTLTPEERFKINEHTLSGLQMLKQIPFPESLSQVPDIACSHHETLVGTGYPLHKTKGQLLLEARILAIADIFEALTASDRPYKKAKSLSETLSIMASMRNKQHIDPELFDIFLEKGVFLQYAQKHLNPLQIDVEDVSPYKSNSCN